MNILLVLSYYHGIMDIHSTIFYGLVSGNVLIPLMVSRQPCVAVHEMGISFLCSKIQMCSNLKHASTLC